MKKIIVAVLLAAFLTAAGFTQDFNNPQIIEKLGLTEQQVEQLKLIYEEAQKTIKDAQLDIDIQKAELKKLLFQSNVDLGQVEIRLRSILEFEYKLRLAEITREVKARGVIGDKEWARLTQMIRNRKEAVVRERKQPESESRERPDTKPKRQ